MLQAGIGSLNLALVDLFSVSKLKTIPSQILSPNIFMYLLHVDSVL